MKFYTTIAAIALVVSASIPAYSAPTQCRGEGRRDGCPTTSKVEKHEDPKTNRGDGRRDKSDKCEPEQRGCGRRNDMNGGSDKPVTFPPKGQPKDSTGGSR